jgi:hypothetical protein
MKYVGLILAAMLVLGGCTKKEDKVFFDGNFYPTKAKHGKGDRKVFVVTVRKASKSLNGAREAGRHGGTLYCLKNFGTSDIIWTIGPDAQEELLRSKSGNLVLKGECHLW